MTAAARRLALPAAIAAALVMLLSFHELVTAAVRQGAVTRQAFLAQPRVSPCHGIAEVDRLEQCLAGVEPQRLGRVARR